MMEVFKSNEETLFQQLKFVRSRTVASLDAAPEELVTVIPEGFNNHLLWHYGHIYVTQELVLHSFLKEVHDCPPHYIQLFARGSKPKEWDQDVTLPSLEELRSHLEEQSQKIIETFSGRLDEIGEEPFKLGSDYKLSTLTDVFGFVIWHEGLHQGTIDGIKRALGLEELFKVHAKK